jgi:hypothetical protein
VPPLAIGKVPVTPVDKGKPVALVNVAEEGVPKAGVTKVGLVAKTKSPEPVSSVTAEAKLALEGVAKKVATFVPRPETPVAIGRPVAFVKVPLDGVPNAGVTSVGLVANTKEPVPVSSVTADARLADDGVAKNVATSVPKPLTPVEIGRPVAFVNVTLAGVPSVGVTSVGEVDRTVLPVPVEVVTPVPPFATGKAVPDNAIASVPAVVIGEPVTDKNDGTVAATEVTLPDAPALLASNFTTPELFFRYNFSSAVLTANSAPLVLSRFAARGTANAVELA